MSATAVQQLERRLVELGEQIAHGMPVQADRDAILNRLIAHYAAQA